MEPFALMLMMAPLLLHMVVISVIRLSGRYHVTTNGRDLASIAFAVSGMIAVGPAELFFPMSAAAVFGPYVWGALALFYWLCVSLMVLGLPQRLVVYGGNPRELFHALQEASRSIDETAEANQESYQIFLPQTKIHLKLHAMGTPDHASISAFESNLSPLFWHQLKLAIKSQLRHRVVSRRRGFILLIPTLLLTAFLCSEIITSSDELLNGFYAWFWR